MTIILGFHGKAGCGKSTAAKYLSKYHGFHVLSFATPIKASLFIMFAPLGLTSEHLTDPELKEKVIPALGKSPRQLMQLLGTEFGRDLVHPDIWVKIMQSRIDEAVSKGHTKIVIDDVRLPNEAAKLVRRIGTIVHLKRPDAKSVNAHSSEAGLEIQPEDSLIINDDELVELYRSLEALVK